MIAKVFYLAGYIEQYGSGTVRMVEWMRDAGLPEPEYKEEMGGFSVYFYKDIYTEENLKKMGLNDRQIKAVMYVKERGKITNKEYQELNNTIKKTASRDMVDLVKKGIFEQLGSTGKGTYYILRRQRGHKGDIKGTNNSSQTTQTTKKRFINDSKGAGRGQMGTKGTERQ